MGKGPLISIITPTINCAAYIRECIDSVLEQDYSNFEHIIIDGGSTDATVEILKQYPHLIWVSEPDKGEADALNKALKMVRGDIIGWLNADDYYAKGVFQKVAAEMDPQHGRNVVYGKAHYVDEKGGLVCPKESAPVMTLPLLLRWWKCMQHPHQPAVFYSKELMADIGPFNQNLCYSIDYEYWLRAIVKYPFHYVNQVFAYARCRPVCKSKYSTPDQIKSHWQVSKPYHRYLRLSESISFWRDYYIGHRLFNALGDIAVWLKLPPRIRAFFRRIFTVILGH